MVILTCTMDFIDQAYNFTSKTKSHQSPSKTSSFTFRLTAFYVLICRLLFLHRLSIDYQIVMLSSSLSSRTYKNRTTKNIPPCHTFLSVRFGGVLFSGRLSLCLVEPNFMPALIPHGIPSVPVVIHAVVPSLVYFVSLASEFVTV